MRTKRKKETIVERRRLAREDRSTNSSTKLTSGSSVTSTHGADE